MVKEYNIAIVVSGKDKASEVLSGLGGAIGKLSTAAIGLGIGAAAGVGALGVGLTKLAVDAAPLAGIREAFYNIAEASGESGDKMLAALQKGSSGMITQRDLMEKYNLAAQLVGDQFANQLPGAMGYLSKVSAATGEDMGFMMDSLVRGVGRLSPMILDNLGVQVDLTTANETYATQIGKTVDELTKQEQQAALMAQVMEKLGENTATLPDVTESANAKMKAMQATLINVKDSIGLALQPALVAVLTPLGELAEEYGPKVTEWAEIAGEWLGENLPRAIDWLGETWTEWWPRISNAISTAWDIAQPLLQALSGWFSEDGPSALSGLQEVWDDKFGWITEWVQENLPLIRDTISVVMLRIEQVTELVLTGISIFWEQHGERIMSIVSSALSILWTLFDTGLRNIFDVVKLIMQLITGDFEGAGETLKGIADRTLEGIQTVFREGLSILGDIISIGLEAAKDYVVGRYHAMLEAGKHLMSGLKQGIVDGIASVRQAIIDSVNEAIASARRSLGIGSPSKVFMDIGKLTMKGLSLGIMDSVQLPAIAMRQAVNNMTYSTHNTNYLTMNVHTRATSSTVIHGFEQMRALYA